jgi:hypothetical protein
MFTRGLAGLAAGAVLYGGLAVGYPIWRVGGFVCHPENKSVDWRSSSVKGLMLDYTFEEDGIAEFACPLPIGPNLIQGPSNSGHELGQVRVRFKHEGASNNTLLSFIRPHDDNSNSYCTCSPQTSVPDAGEYVTHRSYWDECGACSMGSTWLTTLGIRRYGNNSDTYISSIVAYTP